MANEMIKKEQGSLIKPTPAISMFLEPGEKPIITSLPVVKIVHAAQLFQLPDDSTKKEIKGIILDAYPINVYWSSSYEDSSGDSPPDCLSMDAKKPCKLNNDAKPVHHECLTCPMNQYGSSLTGDHKGKACKNIYRLYILMTGQVLPVELSLPPTSFRVFNDYASKLTFMGLPYQSGVCKITLVKKDTFSKVVIDLESICNDMDRLKELVTFRKKMLPLMRGMNIDVEQFTVAKED